LEPFEKMFPRKITVDNFGEVLEVLLFAIFGNIHCLYYNKWLSVSLSGARIILRQLSSLPFEKGSA
jgi:hypothetical protein